MGEKGRKGSGGRVMGRGKRQVKRGGRERKSFDYKKIVYNVRKNSEGDQKTSLPNSSMFFRSFVA